MHCGGGHKARGLSFEGGGRSRKWELIVLLVFRRAGVMNPRAGERYEKARRAIIFDQLIR